jgi:Rieske Fe-S protein
MAPHEPRVPRRDVLVLLGAGGALLATGGLGAVLAACSARGVTTVTLSVDPATLVAGEPVEVPFTLDSGGQAVAGSTWLVKSASGELTAFDPRCTHARCGYGWSTAASQFVCQCHPGLFALDGSVISGPPPRPLDRFPAKVLGDTVQIEVPAGFTTPRASD